MSNSRFESAFANATPIGLPTGIYMRLYFYRGEEPNFGDELNEWLIPRVFPGLLDDDADDLLLAIGSVLFDNYPAHSKKTVFGSGYGGYTSLPTIDDSWNIVCVRGPLTAKALNLPLSKASGDTAILLRNHYTPSAEKKVRVSFMPHFQSIARGQWQRVCKLAGIQFIDPRLPIEDILRMLCESELVLTEAMHGAIVSDALRVPWVAILPFDTAHRMKWDDWAGALDLKIDFKKAAPSTEWEASLQHAKPSGALYRGFSAVLRKPIQAVRLARSAISLRRAATAGAQLSSDEAIHRATDRLQAAADQIIRQRTTTAL